MTRSLMLAIAGLTIASPALADELKPSSGPVDIHPGDTIVQVKPLVQHLDDAGNLVPFSFGYINRQDRGRFTLPKGVTLRPVSAEKGRYVYVPVGLPEPAPEPVAETPVAPSVQPARFGVNLSGCEFGGASDGSLCPNVSDVDWYIDAGFTLIRFPVKTGTPMERVKPAIDRALARGAIAIIDRHEYRWPGVDEQVNYWATTWYAYKNNPNVIFDPMNEPRGFNSVTQPNDWMQWAEDSRDIVAGLRAKGFNNTITLEWPGSAGVYRFDKYEPSSRACESAGCAIDRIGGLGDANVLLQAHNYYDSNGSGTSGSCGAYGLPSRFADELRRRGLRALVGEAAFGKFDSKAPTNPPTGCWKLGLEAIAKIKADPDVYAGVTWWGGGRAWSPGYSFSIAPKGHLLPNAPYVQALTGR